VDTSSARHHSKCFTNTVFLTTLPGGEYDHCLHVTDRDWAQFGKVVYSYLASSMWNLVGTKLRMKIWDPGKGHQKHGIDKSQDDPRAAPRCPVLAQLAQLGAEG
jgi:hypothetical protein